MKQSKTWSMNETQTQFVNVLKEHAEGITLLELKLEGKEFKTGSINTLVAHGIVEIAGEREFACDVMFNGAKVGNIKKTGKVFRLVQKD